jgi:hypothetical protein
MTNCIRSNLSPPDRRAHRPGLCYHGSPLYHRPRLTPWVQLDIPKVQRAVTVEELQARFTPEGGWRILALREALFQNRVVATPAICACVERT